MMAETISALSQTTAANTATNPKSVLGKDDFMKLLLAELQHQDPTDPMDSDKILTQTSQLAQLESQDKTNKALEELAESFKNSKNFSAVSAIGKMARLESSLNLRTQENGSPAPVNFNLNFDEDIQSGAINIYSEDGALVKSMALEKDTAGQHSFNWDGKTNAGTDATAGKYYIKATYQNEDGLTLDAKAGSYKIESVKFEEEKTYVKLNGNFIDFSQVAEIYEEA
jgi:flagellar basal-body rod modification protein FlgD